MDKNEIVSEIKSLIDPLGKAFEAYKAENDKQIKDLKDSGRSDPIIAGKIDKINDELDKITAMKTQLEAKLTAIETTIARGEFNGGGKSEIDQIKAEHKKAFEKWFRRGGESQEAAVRDLQIKAGLSTLSDPDGGYVVTPPEFDTAIDRVAGTMSAMRRLATVRTIGTDTYKKLVNQGGSTSGWVAEKATRVETNTAVLREIAINTKEIYAMPGCTQISLDDAMIDLAAWLADEVSIEFTEEEGSAFINGNGVEKPHGIAGYTFIADGSYSWGKVGYVAGGHATLLNNADKIEDLTYALKPMYLNGASFLMNRTTVGKIRQLKDGEGRSLWQPGMTLGAPNVLFGYPVETDDNVDAIGANKYPVFFGNFKRAYLIIDRMGIRILRDNLTSKGNVLFYCTKRSGAGLVSFESLKALKIVTS
jgi:HK97 family phage major capsid protein